MVSIWCNFSMSSSGPHTHPYFVAKMCKYPIGINGFVSISINLAGIPQCVQQFNLPAKRQNRRNIAASDVMPRRLVTTGKRGPSVANTSMAG